MELSYDAVCFDLFGTLVTGEGSAIDGVRAALEIVAAGRWAIVTSCGRSYAHQLLHAADIARPAVLVTQSDVARGKPAPDPYLLAARLLGVEPSRSLAVEDSPSGAAAARSAGMDVLLIGGRSGAAADFSAGRFAQIAWSVDDAGRIRIRL
jgi:sugar-phosphatase